MSRLEPEHTEEINDILTASPSWLLKWGIGIFLAFLSLIVGISSMIRYPVIIKSELRINSGYALKPILARKSGVIVEILVSDQQSVIEGQTLAYLESSAKHGEVILLLENLKKLQRDLLEGHEVRLLYKADNLQLGEIQNFYTGFFHSYLRYKKSVLNGLYQKRKLFLKKELALVNRQGELLILKKKMRESECEIVEQEYLHSLQVVAKSIGAPDDYKTVEGRLLIKKNRLKEIESAISSNKAVHSAKQKEILNLERKILQEISSFKLGLKNVIIKLEIWLSQYVLRASHSGKIGYAGTIQENQYVNSGQEIFYLNTGDNGLWGQMNIPKYNMGKVKLGQKVIIKLRDFPYEEYGMIRGEINYIADHPYRDSVFVAKVNLTEKSLSELKMPSKLKNGMVGDVEITTEEATLLSRVFAVRHPPTSTRIKKKIINQFNYPPDQKIHLHTDFHNSDALDEEECDRDALSFILSNSEMITGSRL